MPILEVDAVSKTFQIPTVHRDTVRAHALLTLGTLAILGAGALIHRRYAPRAAEYL